MGRVIAIVVLLVAIALVVNRSLRQVDGPAGPLDEAPSFVQPEATEPSIEPLEGEPATEPATEQPAVEDDSDADEAASAPVDESTEVSLFTEEAAAEEPSDAVANARQAAAEMGSETVLLGEEDLLGGIPGEGDLSLAEIESWLADPQNHVVLLPELPLGLAAGADEIKGLDENPLTRAKIELGRQLFFDVRLSSDSTVSCATCHDPDFGYAKDTRFGVGIAAQEGNRNSPTAYNRILSDVQFWDGRAATLEEQAIGPIENPIEMGNTHEVCTQVISDIAGYKKQFEAVFDDGVTIENIGKAIASFERTIVTSPAPWDHYQQLASFEEAFAADLEFLDELEEEDPELYEDYMELKSLSEANPISESAIRGGELFFSDKTGCTACHVGANFTDEKFHNLGVGWDTDDPDLGRYLVTGDEKDRGAFKTPTVRNVALTPPYMHDGSQATLEEVVEWYAKGGHPNPHLSEDIRKLDLTDQDKADLVAFMKEGLTSDLPPVERERLPK